MTADDRGPVDLAAPTIDLMRRRLDALNRRFVAMSDDLGGINHSISDLIGDQPQNTSKQQTDEFE